MVKNYKYNYWERVTLGIEKYIFSKKNDYFLFDNQNFRNAFARKIYILIMRKTIIRDKIFEAILTESYKVTVKLNNKTYQEIFEFMYPEINFNFLYNEVENVVNKTKLPENINSSLNNKIVVPKLKQYDYLFLVTQPKFVRYFSKIYENLESASFILFEPDIQIVELCIKNNYNFLILDKTGATESYLSNDIENLVFQYKFIKINLEKIKPLKIIIPEGNCRSCEVFHLAGNSMDIPTICIQHGWSPIIHIGFKNMNYAKFLTYGEEFSNLLQKDNPSQKFIPVGSHNLNPQSSKNKNFISIICYGKTGSTIVNEEELKEYMSFIIAITRKYPLENFIIREHPSDNAHSDFKKEVLSFENVTCMNGEDYTLDDVLKKTKISICLNSSIVLESLAYNITPFIFNNTTMPKFFPDLDSEKLAIEVSNLHEGLEKFDLLLNNLEVYNFLQNNIKLNKYKYFKNFHTNALNEILREIKE